MGWVTAHANQIRWRLLLVNLLVVAVPLGGIAFARLYERQLLAALERDLIHQAEVVRAAVAAGAPSGAVVRSAGRSTGARIRVTDADGHVIADSSGSSGYDARAYPEIAAALAGRYGAATRGAGDRRRLELSIALPVPGGGAVWVVHSTAPTMAALMRLRRWLFEVLLASLAATAILSLFLAATIARPLARLTRLAERVAAGERGVPLALARTDEIGQLARAVDRMAHELDRRADDQRELAADLAHELRSPLTGIRGAAELLADGAADDPDARGRFLAMIVDDAARLDRMVTRLLELSRAEADTELEPVDLAALAREVAAAHPAPIVVTGEPAVVSGRPRGLAAAIDNLVVNALQHASPGSPVTVTITREATCARVAVHNLGAPISPAVRARVWERFFTTRAGDGGTGLGLAIVRSVAAIHGGAVGIASEPGGTRVWFDVLAP